MYEINERTARTTKGRKNENKIKQFSEGLSFFAMFTKLLTWIFMYKCIIFRLSDNITAAKRTIGYCPQLDALDGRLTAAETLYCYARLKGIPTAEIDEVLVKFMCPGTPSFYEGAYCWGGGNLLRPLVTTTWSAILYSDMYE